MNEHYNINIEFMHDNLPYEQSQRVLRAIRSILNSAGATEIYIEKTDEEGNREVLK